MDNNTILKQLENYIANRSPEQVKEDKELMEEWANVGPTVDEYLKSVGYGE